jgi:hypothetical protein
MQESATGRSSRYVTSLKDTSERGRLETEITTEGRNENNRAKKRRLFQVEDFRSNLEETEETD